MILLIDNYDSFVHNLARYVGELGYGRQVVRNDDITLEDIARLKPEAIILSPGPCTPNEAGICLELIERFGPEIPILGVCLGHQCIGQVYGGSVVRAPKPMHGQSSRIFHTETEIFDSLSSPFTAARYHSLVIAPGATLQVTARTEDGTVMAVQHPEYPVYGVQFHPESVLTNHGHQLLENFLTLAHLYRERKAA